MFKFERLDVWKLSLEYSDLMDQIIDRLPEKEKFNLASQLRRAATSISLNIAEGSTGQSNSEQCRFLGYAIRSLVECIACLRLIERRNYISDAETIVDESENLSQNLFRKLQMMRKSITDKPKWAREEQDRYGCDRLDISKFDHQATGDNHRPESARDKRSPRVLEGQRSL